MNNNKPTSEIRSSLAASSIGIVFVISIAIGSLFGVWLDGKLGTKPIMTLIFMMLGVASGVKNAYTFIKRSKMLEDATPEEMGQNNTDDNDKK